MHRTVTFVAEVSSNHHRDLSRCLAFIDKAAEIGCGAVKFQLFRIRELFAPEILAKSAEHRRREAWELPVEFVPELSARCRQRGVLFSCTPFYLDAVEELLPHVDFYKVASYELMRDSLLRACARTGRPLVLSTGMATMDEVRHAADVVMASMPQSADRRPETGDQEPETAKARQPSSGSLHSSLVTRHLPALTLLHCVSGYPAPADQCNLAAIEAMRKEFRAQGSGVGVGVGWSDHSVNPDVIRRAVLRWGASMVEFHLDLDGAGEEFKTGHCWLPDRIARVIRDVKERAEGGGLKPEERAGAAGSGHSDSESHPSSLLPMDGDGVKAPVPSELPDRDWRADPSDGLRPLKAVRERWRGGSDVR